MGQVIDFATHQAMRAARAAPPVESRPSRDRPELTRAEHDQPVPDRRTSPSGTTPPPSTVPAVDEPEPRPRPAVQPRPLLWREAVGHELRAERHEQGRTQGDVASVAGVSTQYLSEVERGRKEPSSEILEAIGSSLGLELAVLTGRVSRSLASSTPVLLAA
ncbi:helix-turn-helix domain-containing protein [Occultella aeris]|uniref:Transcriptional regulator ClgR n=1 Tax=Occultella aeris TaxID=2761496 RepID=A0A7M4DR09_9MICO|nr:helix-turn-helix transcriptional regulator [Occultella aeris]VZO39903.1 Transcriptional regulator ClgR [Occultella aeris]